MGLENSPFDFVEVEDDGRREQSIGERVVELEGALDLLIDAVLHTGLGQGDKMMLADKLRRTVLHGETK